jgi:hypothetical protein
VNAAKEFAFAVEVYLWKGRSVEGVGRLIQRRERNGWLLYSVEEISPDETRLTFRRPRRESSSSQ